MVTSTQLYQIVSCLRAINVAVLMVLSQVEPGLCLHGSDGAVDMSVKVFGSSHVPRLLWDWVSFWKTHWVPASPDLLKYLC